MGLDSVEFVMALEEAFGLYIPDVDAVSLTTPRKVIDYLEKRLAPAESPQCVDQMAFYSVRRAAMRVLEKPVAPSRRRHDGIGSSTRRIILGNGNLSVR